MPSVKIPRKSTDTDMTPFVDVAFLILSFFMLATKFKPDEPVQIKTPGSVETMKLPDDDAMLVEMDSTGRVFFSLVTKKSADKRAFIDKLAESRQLKLSEEQKNNFAVGGAIGVSFAELPD